MKVIATSGLKIPPSLYERFTAPVSVTYQSEPVAHGSHPLPHLASLTHSQRANTTGLLYMNERSRQPTKAPAIIWAHGGPTGMISHIFSFYAQYFASRGFIFFAANYRGSIGYGKEYREALNGNWGNLVCSRHTHSHTQHTHSHTTHSLTLTHFCLGCN